MTIAELIEALRQHPQEARVTLYDPDTGWLLPIKIQALAADGVDREVDFVAITGDYLDKIEGHGPPKG